MHRIYEGHWLHSAVNKGNGAGMAASSIHLIMNCGLLSANGEVSTDLWLYVHIDHV